MSLRDGNPPSHFTDIGVLYSPPSFLVIRNYYIILVKNLHGRPLRPYLWIRLITFAKMTHFQGQTRRIAVISPILVILCYSPPSFLEIRNYKVIFLNISHGHPINFIY